MARKKNSTDQLQEHERRLLQLREDPALFVKAVLQADPQPWQEEALRAIRDNDRVAIRSGHGVGKTAFLSWVVLWWMLTHYPVKVACTANTASQLSDVLWPEINKWGRKLPEFFQSQLEFKSDKIELKGGSDSFAVARTSRKEQPEALQGFHSPHMLFVVDEASGVPDIIFEVGQGAMSTAGAKTVMVGNPTRSSGYFFDAFSKNSERWWTKRVGCADASTVSSDFLEDMARQYGEDSNIYRVRVLGEFPEADDDVVIPLHLLESATTRDVDAVENILPVWGLDVARFGDDRTALCKRQGNALVEPVKSWRNKDLMEVCGIILTEYESTPYQERPSEILVDSIGLGAGVVDRLNEMDFGADIRGVNVAESPALGQRYGRLRDELWFKAREWLEARDCQMPQDDDLISELSSVRFKYLSSGKLKVESKDEMKRRGQKSPDLADSFVLTFAGQASRAASGSSYGFSRSLNYNDAGWIV
jgi:hypothetical protein|tara:strand:+ start:829 stop:2256 length:1428 start_codon:yes stop_codon:yes gene_type:complete